MPRLNAQALRKPLETEVGITAPRHTRGDYYAILLFPYLVSQASSIQEYDITPLYFNKVWQNFLSRFKITIFC
jgi:isopentenyldiphosphate isomerase